MSVVPDCTALHFSIKIPAVCSLWHRITEHLTWHTRRYYFWLAHLWRQQEFRSRVLCLVSTYFINIYLVYTFSVIVFGSYISGDIKGDSCWTKELCIGGLSEFVPFWSVTHHCNIATFLPITVRKIMKLTYSHPFADYLIRAGGNIAWKYVVRSTASSQTIKWIVISRCELHMNWWWKMLCCEGL